jgi:hypothetical protein
MRRARHRSRRLVIQRAFASFDAAWMRHAEAAAMAALRDETAPVARGDALHACAVRAAVVEALGLRAIATLQHIEAVTFKREAEFEDELEDPEDADDPLPKTSSDAQAAHWVALDERRDYDPLLGGAFRHRLSRPSRRNALNLGAFLSMEAILRWRTETRWVTYVLSAAIDEPDAVVASSAVEAELLPNAAASPPPPATRDAAYLHAIYSAGATATYRALEGTRSDQVPAKRRPRLETAHEAGIALVAQHQAVPLTCLQPGAWTALKCAHYALRDAEMLVATLVNVSHPRITCRGETSPEVGLKDNDDCWSSFDTLQQRQAIASVASVAHGQQADSFAARQHRAATKRASAGATATKGRPASWP